MSPEEIAAATLAGMDGGLKNPPATSQGDPVSDASGGKPRKRRGPKPKIKYPVEPVTIQTIPRRKEYINHSYRDFSSVPHDLDWEPPTRIEQMTFSQKVHDILAKVKEYGKYISWQSHGRAFRVHVPAMFEKLVCPTYFGHKRYSSFLRQLNNHGFKHISKGEDRNCYYHECFLRGLPHLCKYMPEPKDARRQIPDPENEPNFTAITQLYPLPTEKQNVTSPLPQAAPEAAAAATSNSSDSADASSSSHSAAKNDNNAAGTESNAAMNKKAPNTAAPTSTAAASGDNPIFAAAAASNPLFLAAAKNQTASFGVVATASTAGLPINNPLFATTDANNNPLFATTDANNNPLFARLSSTGSQNSLLTGPTNAASSFTDAKPAAESLVPSGSLFGGTFHQEQPQQESLQQQHLSVESASGRNTLAETYLHQLFSQRQQQQQHQRTASAQTQAVPRQIGLDRSTAIDEIRRLQAHLAPSAHEKTVMDRSSALAEMNRLQAQLTGKAPAPAPSPTPHQQERKIMDRNAALAEINQLRARLASELSGQAEPRPPAKRQTTTVVAGTSARSPVAQLARIPQPFPRNRGLSEVEAILQRDAIVSAIQRHQEQQQQQHQHQHQPGGDDNVLQQIEEQHRERESLRGRQMQINELQQLQQQQQQHKQLQALQELETLRNAFQQQKQSRPSDGNTMQGQSSAYQQPQGNSNNEDNRNTGDSSSAFSNFFAQQF